MKRRLFLVASLLAAQAALTAPLAAGEQAVVPVHVIYPGQTITPDALKEVSLHRPPRNAAIARTIEELDGKVARRTLLPGRLVPTGYARAPHLVETGAPVTVVFTDGGLTISIQAVPLQSGGVGDRVKLRNLDSGQTFMGTVLADGTVRVGAA